jgi:hypothetical protein
MGATAGNFPLSAIFSDIKERNRGQHPRVTARDVERSSLVLRLGMDTWRTTNASPDALLMRATEHDSRLAIQTKFTLFWQKQ